LGLMDRLRGTSLPIGQRRFRALLVVCSLALLWWAAWLLDPRNLGGGALMAVVVAGQLIDAAAVVGFWYVVWPRRRPDTPYAPVEGRAAVLVLAGDRPLAEVEATLQAVVAMRRRHRVLLVDPLRRPDLRWAAQWHRVWRLTDLENLDYVAGSRFLAVFEAGQLPNPDFLERLLPCFDDRRLALVQAWYWPRRDLAVGDAILRGADTLGEVPCLGSNYVARRRLLHSVGGFGAEAISPAGALRLGAALRAEGWRIRYAGERFAEGVVRPRFTAGLAAALRPARAWGPAPRPRARLLMAWAALQEVSVLGLVVSAVALGVLVAIRLPPLAWGLSLTIHLAPYLLLRAAAREVATGRAQWAIRRLIGPLSRVAPPRGRPRRDASQPRRVPAVPPRVPTLEAISAHPGPAPEPADDALTGSPADVAPPRVLTRQALTDPSAPPHAGRKQDEEGKPFDGSRPAPRPASRRAWVTRRRLAVVAAAWLLTVGGLGGAAFAVIRANPPTGPIPLQRTTVPPYSYYSPTRTP
jgi:hypothetical protein